MLVSQLEEVLLDAHGTANRELAPQVIDQSADRIAVLAEKKSSNDQALHTQDPATDPTAAEPLRHRRAPQSMELAEGRRPLQVTEDDRATNAASKQDIRSVIHLVGWVRQFREVLITRVVHDVLRGPFLLRVAR